MCAAEQSYHIFPRQKMVILRGRYLAKMKAVITITKPKANAATEAGSHRVLIFGRGCHRTEAEERKQLINCHSKLIYIALRTRSPAKKHINHLNHEVPTHLEILLQC